MLSLKQKSNIKQLHFDIYIHKFSNKGLCRYLSCLMYVPFLLHNYAKWYGLLGSFASNKISLHILTYINFKNETNTIYIAVK